MGELDGEDNVNDGGGGGGGGDDDDDGCGGGGVGGGCGGGGGDGGDSEGHDYCQSDKTENDDHKLVVNKIPQWRKDNTNEVAIQHVLLILRASSTKLSS